MEFIYQARPSRILFGQGKLSAAAEEVAALGSRRALVLCTPQQTPLAQQVAELLGPSAAGTFDGAVMHVPAELVAQGTSVARDLGADCLVAVGGGSTIGLAKALALASGLPILAIPTTYAGSEMTPIYGITENRLKRTGTDLRVLPKTVIYDPALYLSLPVQAAVTSGINAMAHAAEALYARDANPVSSLMAEDAIRALAAGLTSIVDDPAGIKARGTALYGAWLSGTVLGAVGMALHHKLCHTLGGTLNLPHAETHTVVLPHALAYNRGQAPQAMQRIARALGCDDAPTGCYALASRLSAPLSLRELGMTEPDIDRVADIAAANPYWNPRPIERAELQALLHDAYEGRPPRFND